MNFIDKLVLTKLSFQTDMLFFLGAFCFIWAIAILFKRFETVVMTAITFGKQPTAKHLPEPIREEETYHSADECKRPIAKKYIVLDEIPSSSSKMEIDASQPTVKISSLMRKRPLQPTGVA